MKKLVSFAEHLNEAASWGVDVQEPFSKRDEQKSQNKFIIKIDPIKVVGSSGIISEDETDVTVQLSNGCQIHYTYAQNLGYNAEMTIIGANREEHNVNPKELNDYLGSTGTVVGDMLLVYREFYFKSQR